MLEMIGTGGSGPDPERKPAKLLRADESSVEELGIRENDFERRMSEEVADVSRRKKCD
jgi:hypothetical protein